MTGDSAEAREIALAGASAPARPRASTLSWSWSRLDRLCTPARVSAALAVLALIYGVATCHDHGVTFDEPALNYAGDRTLYWLQHGGASGTLDLQLRDPPDFSSAFPRKPELLDPQRYPVLPGLIEAITNWLFCTKLGLTDAIDGHHIGLLSMHVLALFLFCLYMSGLFGRGAAVAATIALALYPSAVGHSFNNAKDWPCAMYYGVFLLAVAKGVVDESFRDLLLAGVLLGVAFAAKFNAVFALATMVIWVPIAYFLLYRRRALPVSVVGGCLLIPYVAGAVFFVTWPWLYQGKLPQWWLHLHEYVYFMVNYGVGDRKTWSWHGLKCLGYMSPPLVLAAAAVFLAVGWRGGRRALSLYALLVLWVGLPVLRISAPRSNYYDANRHFIEYVPALCACAGVGAAWVGARVFAFMRSRRPSTWLSRYAELIVAGWAALACAFLVWPVLEYRPFEATYFNDFAGGLGGAQQAGLFAAWKPVDRRVNGTEGDYWFGSSRQGLATVARWFKDRKTIGLCGMPDWLAATNWPGTPKPKLLEESNKSPIVLVTPREYSCGFRQVRALEAKRPVLRRVERGDGLVYEILGPRDGKKHPVLTAVSLYSKRGWDKSPPK